MSVVTDGRLVIDDAGHEIRYWLHGDGTETLVGLHGGPGMDHRYLERLSEVAGDGLQVLLYDQLGSGESDRPDDASLWVVPRFVEELDTVRKELGLGRVHLLGHSWGGCLAIQYTLDHPEGVKSLISSNIGPSIPEVVRGMHERRNELPTDVYRTIAKHEARGEFEHPEMVAAVNEYYARYTRRSTPFDLETSLAELETELYPVIDDIGPAYGTMWGPYEFICTGSLIDWDVTSRLHEIAVPTLILCGWYDEVVPACSRALADRIPDNEFVIFGNSSHMIPLEKEADAYLGIVRNFVDRVGAGA